MTIDELKAFLAPLGSKPLADFLDTVAVIERERDVLKERLAKSMEREAALKATADKVPKLEAEVANLNRQIATMVDHPDMKARRLAVLNEKIAVMQAEAAKLKPSEKPSYPKPSE